MNRKALRTKCHHSFRAFAVHPALLSPLGLPVGAPVGALRLRSACLTHGPPDVKAKAHDEPFSGAHVIAVRCNAMCRSELACDISALPYRQARSGTRSPLLGEHIDEILSEVLQLNKQRVDEIKASGATGEPFKQAAE
jgi:hypothetical protein